MQLVSIPDSCQCRIPPKVLVDTDASTLSDLIKIFRPYPEMNSFMNGMNVAANTPVQKVIELLLTRFIGHHFSVLAFHRDIADLSFHLIRNSQGKTSLCVKAEFNVGQEYATSAAIGGVLVHLLKTNRDLLDIVVGTIAICYWKMDITLWMDYLPRFEDYVELLHNDLCYSGYSIKEKAEAKKRVSNCEKWLRYYKKGPPSYFFQHIEKWEEDCRTNRAVDLLSFMIDRFAAQSPLEEQILEWAKLGLRLSRLHLGMSDFDLEKNDPNATYGDNGELFVYDYCGFYYGFGDRDDDAVSEEIGGYIDSIINEVGLIPPGIVLSMSPEDVIPVNISRYCIFWDMFTDFMSQAHILNAYDVPPLPVYQTVFTKNIQLGD